MMVKGERRRERVKREGGGEKRSLLPVLGTVYLQAEEAVFGLKSQTISLLRTTWVHCLLHYFWHFVRYGDHHEFAAQVLSKHVLEELNL